MASLTEYLLEKSGLSEWQIAHYNATFAAAKTLRAAGIDCTVKEYFTSSPTQPTVRIEIVVPQTA